MGRIKVAEKAIKEGIDTVKGAFQKTDNLGSVNKLPDDSYLANIKESEYKKLQESIPELKNKPYSQAKKEAQDNLNSSTAKGPSNLAKTIAGTAAGAAGGAGLVSTLNQPASFDDASLAKPDTARIPGAPAPLAATLKEDKKSPLAKQLTKPKTKTTATTTTATTKRPKQ